VSTPKGNWNLRPELISFRNLIAEQIKLGDQYYMHIILQTIKSKGQISANLDGLSSLIKNNILEDISSKFFT
jgi:hypothetical protein